MPKSFIRATCAGLITALPLCIPVGAHAASTTCNTVAACVFGINTASGSGVEGNASWGIGVNGVSKSGYGVEGSSKTNDGVVGHAAVNPTSAGTGKAGIAGYDDSTNKTAFNSGVYGVSTYATGVQGRSTNGPGIFALSYKNNGIMAVSGKALYSGFTNAGVVAQSATGDGMIGVGEDTGIVGFATSHCTEPSGIYRCNSALGSEIPSGGALTAGTDQYGVGLNVYTDADPEAIFPGGVGATISSGGVGMMITPDREGDGIAGLIVNGDMAPRDCCSMAAQGAIIAGYNAMSVTAYDIGIAVSGASAIVAQGNVSGGSTVFQGITSTGKTTSQLDDAGNLVIAGKLTENGTITSQLRNSDGTYSASYTAHSTLPTVEDMGEAKLVSGAAFVTIDSALRKSIDVSRGYLVFLTPQGPTSGLYVTGKSASGFNVREIANGRDSLAFDFRIVAQPYAEQGQRLARATGLIRSTTAGKALFYRHMKPLRFNHGKLDPASLPVPSM